MNGNGQRDQRPVPQAPPPKVQILTFDHFAGRALHTQLAHMPAESRQALSFLGNLISSALNGVSRTVTAQGTSDR
jgi:hypothetical protein